MDDVYPRRKQFAKKSKKIVAFPVVFNDLPCQAIPLLYIGWSLISDPEEKFLIISFVYPSSVGRLSIGREPNKREPFAGIPSRWSPSLGIFIISIPTL